MGNLISNTIIVVVSLSVSPFLALTSLAFLIVIHKLEYFVNARLMGTQIRAREGVLCRSARVPAGRARFPEPVC